MAHSPSYFKDSNSKTPALRMRLGPADEGLVNTHETIYDWLTLAKSYE